MPARLVPHHRAHSREDELKVAYIAGPYRASTPFQIQRNIREAAEIALKYWKLGYAVICPHTNTALFDGEAPDNVWLEGDLELIRRSDVIVMTPRWRDSSGARAEYESAVSLGIDVYFEGEADRAQEMHERMTQAGCSP